MKSAGLKIVLAAPSISTINPFLVKKDTTVAMQAIVNSSNEAVEKFQLWINSSLTKTSTTDTLLYDLDMSTKGHWDVKFLAESTSGKMDSLELRFVFTNLLKLFQFQMALKMALPTIKMVP